MRYISILVLTMMLWSCSATMATPDSNDFTLGKVQSELKVGMNSSEVVVLFGSPNLVTSRKEGGEAWTYDKISWLTESSSVGGVVTGWTPKFFGIFGGNKSRNEKSSKNITLVIKLNGDGNVEDFKYQSVKY